jgi:hypothetical protein
MPPLRGKQKPCCYYDTPEHDQLVHEAATLLGVTKSAFIRMALDRALAHVRNNGEQVEESRAKLDRIVEQISAAGLPVQLGSRQPKP